ncbi:MAG: hypothetical protein GX049_11550 [Alcaligenaceae bacterium]|nr:hypothetical protein [Alcaligenaceae bacterium]
MRVTSSDTMQAILLGMVVEALNLADPPGMEAACLILPGFLNPLESPVLNHMTPDALRDWFARAPDGPCTWISGEVIVLAEHLEVVAFQFDQDRYLMFFSALEATLGTDPDLAEDVLQNWVGTFRPAKDHRLIKFIRADANDPEQMFDYHLWPLRNPRQVFQFGQFLVDVAMQHWQTMRYITQYLYQPAYPALTKLYQRTLKNHEGCRQAGFRPILNSDIESGGYYGCEKT